MQFLPKRSATIDKFQFGVANVNVENRRIQWISFQPPFLNGWNSISRHFRVTAFFVSGSQPRGPNRHRQCCELPPESQPSPQTSHRCRSKLKNLLCSDLKSRGRAFDATPISQKGPTQKCVLYNRQEVSLIICEQGRRREGSRNDHEYRARAHTMMSKTDPAFWVAVNISLVSGTCRRFTSTEEAAREAAQETWLAYCVCSHRLDLERSPGPWLRETARRCSLAVERKKARFSRLRSNDDVGNVAGFVDHERRSETEELIAVLLCELEQLHEDDRKILNSVCADEMPHVEAADRIGCPVGSIHHKLNRAQRRLRRKLRPVIDAQ